MPDDRMMLRHTVATLAYRAAKALRGAPPGFAEVRGSPTSRNAGQILAHMCDLFDWALHLAHGKHVWKDTQPTTWEADSARFFAAVKAFDDYLASDQPLGRVPQILFQGPVADALAHTGQINYLRRMGGSPVRGESYARADIMTGRVTADQAPPKAEFD
ncbi:MAG TPA: hypothetical protein VMS45_07240 [Gemmatimonadaceae bacterium]|nr:hypothetical protein [Gemmatimonadaceae bacterium]